MRSSTTAFLPIFLVAHWANAQVHTGWVLWQKSVYSQPAGDAATEWLPDNGFDLRIECEAAAVGGFRGYSETVLEDTPAPTLERFPDKVSGVFVYPKDRTGYTRTWALSFVCFPAEFDPRPRGNH